MADGRGYSSFMHLAAGLSVGLTGIAAGYTIGIVGDAVCASPFPPRSETQDTLVLIITRVFGLTCNNPVSTWA